MLNHIKSKISDLSALSKRVDAWRAIGEEIVFTNGCFDLLHLGHISYLAEARALGDRLIIGLNSDASVTKLKGVHRPIHDVQSRAMMLASMEFVDAVVVFEEDTPLILIETLLPDVLVKGGDYKLNQIIGHDVVLKAGGVVKTIAFLEGYSSTKIETRIKGA